MSSDRKYNDSGKILAWHFTNGWKLLDGQELIVGKTYRFDGKLKLCPSDEDLEKGEGGFHASKRILSALMYAPGTIVSRVKCEEIGQEEDDKFVCRKRTVLWAIDIEMILHEFACQVAEHALRKAKIIDKRSWNVIETKREWMRGEASKKQLDAAKSAATVAVWSQVELSAQYYIRWHTAESVACTDGEFSAKSAVWYVAESAKWYTEEHAARYAQDKLLEKMVLKPHKNRMIRS